METDAVPELSHNIGKEKKSTSNKNKKKDSQLNVASLNQNIFGNSYNINNSKNFHIGNSFYIGKQYKSSNSKNSSKVHTKKKREKDINNTEECINNIEAVMKNCIHLVTMTDIKIIQNLIQSSWIDLARNIMVHTDCIDTRLTNSEAVEQVLVNWIEEHSSSGLVAILVKNLWEMHETNAARELAAKYSLKKKEKEIN